MCPSLNTVLLFKHSSSFRNMSQSPPKDYSYMGLLLHCPSWGSQATGLALLANASAIARPNLPQQSRRDVRTVPWSNDVLSTLLDLYDKKYLAFGHGSFWVKDWKDILKKFVTHILAESARTTTQFRDKGDKMKKKYFQEKTLESVTGSATTLWVWSIRWTKFWRAQQRQMTHLMNLIKVMLMMDLLKHQTLKKIY